MLAARHQSFNGKHSSALITAHSADAATPEIAAERRNRAHVQFASATSRSIQAYQQQNNACCREQRMCHQ